MVAHGEAILLELVCGGLGCTVKFLICSHCYRGHRYCCEACRKQTQLELHRQANREYWMSSDGPREDHRLRQQEYRRCRAQISMPDATSISDNSQALSECGKVEPTVTETPQHSPAAEFSDSQKNGSHERPCCRICGRVGRLAESFPPIFRRGVFMTRSKR
jgi:hypothetical protein